MALEARNPVISVDGKKKENVGNYANKVQTVTINHAIMAGGAQMKTGQRHKLTEKSSCDSQITMLY